jgi:hypothetical protein
VVLDDLQWSLSDDHMRSWMQTDSASGFVTWLGDSRTLHIIIGVKLAVKMR